VSRRCVTSWLRCMLPKQVARMVFQPGVLHQVSPPHSATERCMRDGIKCFSTVEENSPIDRQLVGDGTEVFHDKRIGMSLQYSLS